MNICYIAEWDFRHESGVSKKIQAQLKAWDSLGVNACAFIFSEKSTDGKYVSHELNFKVFPTLFSGGVAGKLAKSICFNDAKKELIKFNADIIYYRDSSWSPGIVGLLGLAKKLVIEINSDFETENNKGNFFKRKYHEFTRGAVIKAADGLVCVTNELSVGYKKYHKPIKVIGNSFDTSLVVPRPPIYSDCISAVFVGTDGQDWHGVDKIIKLAELLPDVRFNIVGISGMPDLKVGNVVLHGVQGRSYLSNLYKDMDFGFGTMALHRKNMNEASPLKVREYLAHGLPVVGCYKDTDIDNEDYFLELPNVESGIGEYAQEIYNFALSWKGKSINMERVRNSIDALNKEKLKVNFFNELLMGGNLYA